MKRSSSLCTLAGTSSALLFFTAHAARAQSWIQTHGSIVVAEGQQVPGSSTGVGFHVSPHGPALDDAGNIVFEATSYAPGGNPYTGRVIGYGSNAANLTILAHENDPAPGIPGQTMSLAGGATSVIRPSITPDGRAYWACELPGVPVPWEDGDAVFSGAPTGLSLIFRLGEAMPGGPPGARLSADLGNDTAGRIFMNRHGQVLFGGGWYGGTLPPPTGSTWMSGQPGALQQIGAAGAPVPGGAVFQTYHAWSQLNDVGQVWMPMTLSSTYGSPPATAFDDVAFFVWTPGIGVSQVLREGDPVPGLPPGNAFHGDPWPPAMDADWYPRIGINAFNRSGSTALALAMRGPNVTPFVDDQAIFIGGPSGLVMSSARRGSPAPGTSAVFDTMYDLSVSINNAGSICFVADLRGPGTVPGDHGIWAGPPGAVELVMRVGDPCPSVPGATIAGIGLGQGPAEELWPCMNERGQVLFQAWITGGGTTYDTNYGLFVYDRGAGTRLLAQAGDLIEVRPGVMREIAVEGFFYLPYDNGDANPLGFNRDGKVALAIEMTNGENALAILDTRQEVRSFCFGDGVDTSHAAACPCGNNGARGNGCANSLIAEGANLRVAGVPLRDDMVLHAQGMPNTVTCVYLQGDALADAVFGDGVRCIGGHLLRLGSAMNAAGRSSFPDSTHTTTLSARGGVAPGSGLVREYQTYYRNITAAFCPPAVFNVTNAVEIHW